MHTRRLTLPLLVAALVLGAAPGVALAAGAYASDPISIYELPRQQANEIVGLLHAGEQVTIDRCTPEGRWCRVFSSQRTGWVPASYLVGAAAKVDATPLPSLTSPPFDEQRDLDHTKHGFW